MITIYYPYWEAGSTWDELRYSVRSLEKHLKEPFEITLVGDCPDWIKNISHIAYKRDEGRSSLWNTNRMMELFLEQHGGDFYIRMYDDIYLLRDIELEELKVTRIVRTGEEVMNLRSGGSVWRKQVLDTVLELCRRKYKGYLTESHCPELFSGKKMGLIYRVFDLPEMELLSSTLYYNVFPYVDKLEDKKTQRVLFYDEENDYSFSSENIEQKCAGKYFLNHNDGGLNAALKFFLGERFTEKSRYEK